MTIEAVVKAYDFFKHAIPLLNASDLFDLYCDVKGFIIMPGMWLHITFVQCLLDCGDFPHDIVEFKLFGHEMLKFIESVSLLYQNTIDSDLYAVQCLDNIPLRQMSRLNVLMGKCLNSIAEDVLNNELVTITTKNGNLVVMSEADWEGVLETLYLMSDPEFEEDVREGLNTPMSEREAWN